MNLYAFPSFLVGIINISIGIYVLTKNPKDKLNISYFLIMLAGFVWCFGEFMMRLSIQPLIGTFWARVTWLGVIFTPSFILFFSLIFTKALTARIRYVNIIIGFIICFPSLLFALIILYTNSFIYGVDSRWWGFTAARVESIFFPIYLIFHITFIFISLLVLYVTHHKEPKGTAFKSQVKYASIGISIPTIFGSFTQIILPLIGIDVLPIASFLTIFMAGFIGYAILKYKLMVLSIPLTAESIIEFLGDLLFVTDVDDKIVKVNRPVIDLLGFKETDLLGKFIKSVFKEKKLLGKKELEKLDGNTIKDFEVDLITKNRIKIPVSLSISAIKSSFGDTIGYVYIGKDIQKTKENIRELEKNRIAILNIMEDLNETNVKLIEAQKRLKKNIKELKSLDEEKDEFISIAAHELKTPMTAIHGFAQLLENEKIIKDKETRNRYLKIMRDEIERLSKMITDILDLSRADLGTLKFTIEEIDIAKLVEEVKNELLSKIEEKGLKLTVKMDNDLSTMRADKEKLKQILINLIGNSMKFTEKGGIKVEIHRENNNVKFSVTDTGIGIAKKDFGKIFKRFSQVESAYTRKVGGTGLGLSICKAMIEAMNGNIWFESKLGKGSKFSFLLPIKISGKPKEDKYIKIFEPLK